MTDASEREGGSRRKLSPVETARLVVGAVVLLLFVLFVLDNTEEATFGWVFGEGEVPMIVVLIITALVGGVLGFLAGVRSRRRR